MPASLAFSPDARLLSYLFSERGDLTRELWALDCESGERRIIVGAPDGGTTDANVNPDEALRRERQRLREGGVTHYSWAKDADRLLIPINGQLYVTSSRGDGLRPLAPAESPAADARLTPDGTRVVFVRDRELWVADVDDGAARRLTFDATETISNGLAEYIAQEEMGRSAGFWIAPDGHAVAYTQVEEGHIPAFPIVHQGEREWRTEYHRYPFAGGANARVRLGVLGLADGATRWLDLGPDADIYLARVDWGPDGGLYVQLEARHQRRLDLWRYAPDSGERTRLLVEETDTWINLHNDLRILERGAGLIWSSERSGFRHLYLYGPEGREIRQLTDGDWPVDALAHVDEGRRVAYFLAGRESPLERHLYRVPLGGGTPARLTPASGFHSATFAADGSRYALVGENHSTPPGIVVRSVDDTTTVALYRGPSPAAISPGLRPPELVEIESRDGERLYGAIYRPTGSTTRPAAIVSVYGGPHAQIVSDTWGMTVDLRAQYLAARGFLVFKLDNRGSARRGLAFEGALRHRMGTIEVQDQVDGARWLTARGLADPARIGIYGWSYGGYMAVMCLLKAPETFRVAVAGAPVTDWDGYDTHYTERYMGSPAANPEGYRAGSALTHAGSLGGKLLLIHGMIDENVHFRHTARLMAALQAGGRPFDLLLYPGERHMPRSEEGRRLMEARIAEYFEQHL